MESIFKMNLEKLLMGPGPSNCSPSVYNAISLATIGHLDPVFLNIMEDTTELLRYVFQTKNNLTIPISGTGSAGMEAACVNIIEPGDNAVVCINGLFGERLADTMERCGANVVKVEFDWGKEIDPQKVEKVLKEFKKIKVVALVHGETSTGVLQPLSDLIPIIKKYNSLALVDTVTSLGCTPVEVDKHGLDVVYSGTQKCLSCPPGLAPLTLSEKATKVIENRKKKVQSWYLDLNMIGMYWGKERFYHHTAPINMIYALKEALTIIYNEGIDNCFERHRLNSNAFIAGVEALGLKLLVDKKYRLPSLVSVVVPEGINDVEVRSRLLKNHNLEIGGGLGNLKGKIWRIGIMGYVSRRENVFSCLEALANTLVLSGWKCSPEDGIAAATSVYNDK